MVDDMSKLPFNFKQEFKMNKKIAELDKLMRDKDNMKLERREILDKHGIGKFFSYNAESEEPSKKNTPRISIETGLSGIALFRHLMRKNRGKFACLRVFSGMADKYQR